MQTSTLTLAGIDADLPAILIIGCVFIIIIVGTVLKTVSTIYQTRQREGTRREVAAYVAEGSISPDDAERILTAGEQESVEIGKCGIHIRT